MIETVNGSRYLSVRLEILPKSLEADFAQLNENPA